MSSVEMRAQCFYVDGRDEVQGPVVRGPSGSEREFGLVGPNGYAGFWRDDGSTAHDEQFSDLYHGPFATRQEAEEHAILLRYKEALQQCVAEISGTAGPFGLVLDSAVTDETRKLAIRAMLSFVEDLAMEGR